MAYGETSMRGRIDWRSLLFGGTVATAMAYVGLVLPARSQISMLEGQVIRLAASVARLDGSGTSVDQATTLLARLEAQGTRLAAVEQTITSFERLGDRLIAASDRLETARTTLGRIDDLHRTIASRADAIAALDAALAKVDAMTTRAGERADRLLALEERLVHTGIDARAADAALVRLTDLAEMLSGASGTVGQLQRFVVEVMLLEPAVGRAMRALEPVVEFTQGAERPQAKDGKGRSAVLEDKPADVANVTEVARAPADEKR